MQFNVQTTSAYGTKADGSTDYNYANQVKAFKVVGYSGAGVNFPTESKITKDEAEAARWCEALNAGQEVPEASCGSYSDD